MRPETSTPGAEFCMHPVLVVLLLLLLLLLVVLYEAVTKARLDV